MKREGHGRARCRGVTHISGETDSAHIQQVAKVNNQLLRSRRASNVTSSNPPYAHACD